MGFEAKVSQFNKLVTCNSIKTKNILFDSELISFMPYLGRCFFIEQILFSIPVLRFRAVCHSKLHPFLLIILIIC